MTSNYSSLLPEIPLSLSANIEVLSHDQLTVALKYVTAVLSICLGLGFAVSTKSLFFEAQKWLVQIAGFQLSSTRVQGPQPPCEQIVERAERYNETNKNENRGALSRQYGFVPVQDHRARLPSLYQPWETVASSMDVLMHTQTIGVAIESLPLIDAEDSDVLPDRYLVRASIILCHLAYFYVNAQVYTKREKRERASKPVVPECVKIPWTQVCKRLGRQEAFMTYIEAVGSSHVRDPSVPIEKTAIDNFHHLVQFQRTQQSDGFLGTMFETAALAQPILHHVILAQRAVITLDTRALTQALGSIRETVLHVRRVTVPKLSPHAKSKYYVDPIAWVKSVANLGLHWSEIKHIPGPSGTGHPFFHLMDVFVGRTSYGGIMGHEASRTRKILPPHWQELFEAVEQVSVGDYVKSTDDKNLKRAWNDLYDAYAGEDGLLGFHKRKVFGYLYIAFRVGRSSTINGFTGNTRQEPWNIVTDALEEARQHRALGEPAEQSILDDSQDPESLIPVSHLMKHGQSETGYWIAAQGRVYDITTYIRHHPGGHKILLNCAGRDVSQDLRTVRHLDDPKIRKLMASYACGKLSVKGLHHQQLQSAYDMSIALGYQVNDLASTFQNHASFIDCRLSGLDIEGDLSPFKTSIYHDMEEHLRLEVVATMSAYIDCFVKALREVICGDAAEDLTDLMKRLSHINQNQENCPPDIATINVTELRRLIAINGEYFNVMRISAISVVEMFEDLLNTTERLDDTQSRRIACLVGDLLDCLDKLGRAR